ncbi:trimeric intracellular cation channel family protein [Pseudonocardia kujensis]|uniref:trimeric intracellular cation channel family protein n=1 Tax=Pseudonocardia kujensis TaxID=1128675 RepID=UPI001E308EEC|nr:trimeric intracellular cation channel family protein [Pseudonocardia kujensis]MCE0762470.1 trimeric intracellular cation channel family protein [Pseudonocardia kujensis]
MTPPEPPLLLALDLTGTFVFGLNGALTAVRAARLDIVGVLALAVITALGGGITRDVLIGAVPPAAFRDWRYLALALGGGLVAFALSRRLERLETPIVVLDAVGLSVFAVIGAAKALEFGLGIGPAILLGAITAVGGGTIRDTLVRQIPSVLHSDLYAIPALLAAALTAAAVRTGTYGLPTALGAAAICFAVRMIGVRFRLNAPGPPGGDHPDGHPDSPRDDERDDG